MKTNTDNKTASAQPTNVREKWAIVYSEEEDRWLAAFDGGGRPIWTMNRLRAGVFAPSEINLPSVHFYEATKLQRNF